MAENNESAAAPANTGKRKRIILLAVLVSLVLALSGAAMFWFLGGGLPGQSDDGDGAPEVVEDVFVPTSYHLMTRAVVTAIQSEGRQRYAQAHLALASNDAQALEAAKLHMPLIRSQLVTALGRSDFKELQTPEGRRDLADRMLATVNQVLGQEGEPAIDRVLFRNFVVQ